MENEEQIKIEEPAINIERPLRKKANGVWKFFVFGFLGLLVLLLIVGVGVAYGQVKKLSENPAVLFAAKTFGMPIAKINSMKVFYSDYVEDLQTLRKFYVNPPQGVTKPSDELISDQVLSRLVANRLVQSLVNKYRVKVAKEDMEKFKTDLLTQFESEQKAEEELQTRYGWTLEKYLEKVGRPIVLEQKLQESIKTQQNFYDNKYAEPEARARHILFVVKDKTEEAKAKREAEAVLARIKKGEDFATLAKEFGSDSTKDEGGDLGWFTKDMMVPEFSDAVFKLEPGQVGDLVQTEYGFHIVKLEEKRMSQNFIAFMNDQFKDAKIEILLPVHDPFTQIQQNLNNANSDVQPAQ